MTHHTDMSPDSHHPTDSHSIGPGGGEGQASGLGGASLILEARPERLLIRPTGSRRHIYFRVAVPQIATPVARQRTPLRLALVLDRSGSMSGQKLDTAKSAAMAVIERLDERDTFAVVVFDDHIDLLQAAVAADARAKGRARSLLAEVEARASTALHQGWLTGCEAIAVDRAEAAAESLSRCFLLTDGLANVGLTDPEAIAAEAAGVRQHTRISTSTFGIGDDYEERLLGPMAVAGGGQFHHLRSAEEITKSFAGELGDLLAVVAAGVRLEIEAGPGVELEMVSQYWATKDTAPSKNAPAPSRWSVAIGDLTSDEQRHLVARVSFPPQGSEATQKLRARLVWNSGQAEHTIPWQETVLTYASHAACDAEARDPEVMHWTGLHHAERARREATELSRQGNLAGAGRKLRQVAGHIASYANNDPDLCAAIQDLPLLAADMELRPMSPGAAKEMYFQSQRRSRGQKDQRA